MNKNQTLLSDGSDASGAVPGERGGGALSIRQEAGNGGAVQWLVREPRHDSLQGVRKYLRRKKPH